jgi:hypothetical protein
MVNIGMGIGFLIVVFVFCYSHYKGVPTPEERQQQMNKTQQYVLQKINNYRMAKQHQHQELITSLPLF